MTTERLVLGHFHTNCYILSDSDTKEAIVIDPAHHGDRIYNAIEQNGYKVKYIIITHSHIDHIMGLDYLFEKTGAIVCAGEIDADSINDNEACLATLFSTHAPKTMVQKRLRDNDELELAGKKIIIIHTPGHTPGGVCIYIPDENILFSGDTLFNMSVGRCDFPGGSMKSLCESIKTKLFALPGKTIVYPGHNDSTTIQFEKENNFFI